MMNSTWAVCFPDSQTVSIKAFQVSSRYTNWPNKKAYAVAKTAASVGVTTPEKMAIKINGGSARAGIAFKKVFNASLPNFTPSETGKLSFLACRPMAIINPMPIKRPGIIPAKNKAPTETLAKLP